MTRHLWGGCIVLLLAAVSEVSAQVREVSGRVTNEQTGQGVGDAVISVRGTGIAARSAANGRFAFNVPDGDQTLTIRAIGFKRDSVVVPALEQTVAIALEPDPFKLEEVVVTGQSTGIEKRNLPNAVATVSASELTRAPTPTLESALQGKIPGALIQANSGAPGGGIQVNLRGTSTIQGDINNLFVIDGVVISNEAIPNGADAVTAAQAGGNPRNQDNPVNRIADLNPEDIERRWKRRSRSTPTPPRSPRSSSRAGRSTSRIRSSGAATSPTRPRPA
jgi:hypothetical protein